MITTRPLMILPRREPIHWTEEVLVAAYTGAIGAVGAGLVAGVACHLALSTALHAGAEAPPSAAVGEVSPTDAGAWTFPNLLTLASAASSVAWLSGASGWWALLGLLLDEVDGRLARATGTTSEVGSQFDWASDVALNAATMMKLGGPFVWALPPVLAAQAYLRAHDIRPKVGSARAVTTLALLQRQGFFVKALGL